MRTSRILFILFFLAVFSVPLKNRLQGQNKKSDPKQVLFIGNSFTFFVMPTLKELIINSGQEILITDLSIGGMTLQKHWSRPQTLKAIRSKKWDMVIIQEQSQALGLRGWRQTTLPYAQNFHKVILEQGCETWVYETWGYAKGDYLVNNDNYFNMQRRLIRGARDLATMLHVNIIPVGQGWQKVLERDANKQLWIKDGQHPNATGSYLAACILFQAITNERPPQLNSLADVSRNDLVNLREMGASVFN